MKLRITRIFKEMDFETIENLKYILIFLVIVNMIFVYWFFSLKRLAIALFLLLLVFLIYFLFLEHQKAPKYKKEIYGEKIRNMKKPRKKEYRTYFEQEKEQKPDFLEKIGLPDAESIRKNIDKALSNI